MKKYVILLLITIFAAFLRFYNVQNNPPGLYIDEVSIGYNAYTILHTGKDEYGVPHPLLFKAFGEYKLPVYIYSTAISMAIFGKNEFAVRFPSTFFGVLTIPIFYFFLKELLDYSKLSFERFSSSTFSLIGSFLLAISSWHIQFSRAGFEASLSLFLYLTGSFFAVMFFRSNKLFHALFSIGFFVLTIYTYNTYRIVTPITVFLYAIFLFFNHRRNNKKKLVISAIVFLVLLSPMILFSITNQGTERFLQTSAFGSLVTTNIKEKLSTYPIIFLSNYFSYFSFNFLFSNGDNIGRHQIPGFGNLFKWQLPFLLIGMYQLLCLRKTFFFYAIIFLLLIAPFPAALVVPSPHTLRTLLMVIPLLILITMGILRSYAALNRYKLVIGFIGFLALYEFIYYLHFYYVHYPKTNIVDWGGGYKQIVEKTTAIQNKYYAIVVDKNLGYAPIYFKFYNDQLHPDYVGVTWKKPKEWGDKKILYIRPAYNNNDPHVRSFITLDMPNRDVFAEFWEE